MRGVAVNRDCMSAERIEQLARAFQQSRVLLTGVELKVFTALGEAPASADEVAERTKSDARAMDRLLCALAAMGMIVKKDGVYVNTPSSARYLSENSPDCIRSMGHIASMFHGWSQLTDCVRRGEAVRDHSWERDEVERFIAAMDYRSTEPANVLAETIRLDGVASMLDVGGGSGIYSRMFCRRNPQMRSTIIDLPKVTPLTRQFVAQDDLEDRIEIVEGDFHHVDFGSGYDLVLLSAILHMNSPMENAKLLKKAFAAINPGGRIAVDEFVMNEHRTEPFFGTLFSLNMLVNTPAGDSYTESEIRDWLEQAGCVDITRTSSGATTSLIIGVKPSGC